ncbi:MAG TPA: hypothetical protein VJP02_31735 [Candidatus Sulfotelmatobacter sp.]|nr:hypothetical protein [Candidatus Sulfotelmatobacter sp.]
MQRGKANIGSQPAKLRVGVQPVQLVRDFQVREPEITATVPTGAATGKIVVTTKGGSATSSTTFTVN